MSIVDKFPRTLYVVYEEVEEAAYQDPINLAITLGGCLLDSVSFDISSANNFFIGVPRTRYEATSSRKSRCLAKELTTGAVASVFLVWFWLLVLASCLWRLCLISALLNRVKFSQLEESYMTDDNF
ncbi:unnamed protein product [Camellia sinensis]